MTDTGHWHINLETFNENDLGFIYVITNLVDNRYYIGQKIMWNKIKRPPLKGRVNKRHVLKESDWRTYTGSNTQLNEDIKRLGDHQFKFEIVQTYNSKWSLNYAEVEAIVGADAVRRNDCYNAYVSNRLGDCPKSEKY